MSIISTVAIFQFKKLTLFNTNVRLVCFFFLNCTNNPDFRGENSDFVC